MNASGDIVGGYEIFRDMKPGHVEILTAGARVRELRSGEILFREGEPAAHFYLIESGRIALEARKPTDGVLFVQAIDAGQAVGWSWLFPPYRWHFQARAVEPTKVIVFDGARMVAEAERNHDFGYDLLKRVTPVLVHRLNTTRRQLLSCQAGASLES
jgi:CRP/FNR family cyclic AMP-dependent transcriptional regulator